jgi:hypothetical protein
MEIDDVCLDCRRTPGSGPEAPRSFRLNANGHDCRGTVAFDSAREEYVVESPDLARRFRYKEGTRRGTLVDLLNASQSFVVIPETPEVIYSESGFFNPRLGLGASFNSAALGLNDMIGPGSRPARLQFRERSQGKRTPRRLGRQVRLQLDRHKCIGAFARRRPRIVRRWSKRKLRLSACRSPRRTRDGCHGARQGIEEARVRIGGRTP